jgi:hypothetical protein
MSQELQIERVMTNVRALKTPLEKYSHLVALLVRVHLTRSVGSMTDTERKECC